MYLLAFNSRNIWCQTHRFRADACWFRTCCRVAHWVRACWCRTNWLRADGRVTFQRWTNSGLWTNCCMAYGWWTDGGLGTDCRMTNGCRQCWMLWAYGLGTTHSWRVKRLSEKNSVKSSRLWTFLKNHSRNFTFKLNFHFFSALFFYHILVSTQIYNRFFHHLLRRYIFFHHLLTVTYLGFGHVTLGQWRSGNSTTGASWQGGVAGQTGIGQLRSGNSTMGQSGQARLGVGGQFCAGQLGSGQWGSGQVGGGHSGFGHWGHLETKKKIMHY